MSSRPWQTCLITGASTGIGRHMALDLARAGVRVTAIARSADKLQALQAEAALITPLTCDVSEASASERIRDAISSSGVPDLAILNAGVWHPMGARDYDGVKAAESMRVNYIGVTNCLAALMPAMIARGRGHIAIVASVAGYRGLPQSAAYAPTKAALINLAESLHSDLARFGVKVSIVNPGFVDTPMTSINKFPMPYIITVEDATERILAGLAAGKYEVAFPWQVVMFLKLTRMMPNRLYNWFAGRFILPRGPQE